MVSKKEHTLMVRSFYWKDVTYKEKYHCWAMGFSMGVGLRKWSTSAYFIEALFLLV